MSRTRRNKSRTIVLGKSLGRKVNLDGTVRDGTPTHYSPSCERGGDCPICSNNRQIRKIKTEEKSLLDLEEENDE